MLIILTEFPIVNYLFNEFSLSGFIFNILCSVIASLIFILLLLYTLKPKFKIVGKIAKNDSPFDSTDEICYFFKIINKSFFDAYDIQAKVNSYKIKQGENGIVNRVHNKIELKTSQINYVKRNKFCQKNSGENCVQFVTYEDLTKLMSSGDVHIQITARHSLTGLSNIFTYDFVNKSSIIEGKFKEGDFEEVIEC